jgi:hypothetical protein
MSKKGGVSIQTTIYNTFRGADFSTDPSLVEKYRSPLCTNIIADSGGMPEKRWGWRVLHRLSGSVNGLHAGNFDGKTKRLAHVGTKLYEWEESNEAPKELLTGLANGKSRSVYLKGKLWIADGKALISYDGTAARKVTAGDCYVPTVVITRMPDGGGVMLEEVNLLTPRRKESFQTDGAATSFKLSAVIDAGSMVKVWVWDEETTDFTWSGDTVTLKKAPKAPDAGKADGLVIEYSHTVEGYADRINRCRIVSSYGLSGDDRLVLSGNPDFPNWDWISGFNEPTYFPDRGYAVLGSEDTAILGYARVGSYQAVVKSDNGQEPTVYLRSGTLNDEGRAMFTTQAAMSGVGAVAAGSFASLLDDPLFLSGTGVYGISISDMSGSRVTQNRSYFLNPKLTEEAGLKEAEGIAWKGMYLLATPAGHVYVLDARQEKSYRSAAMADFVYEAYYWENVPARVWMKLEQDEDEWLYFGTEDGRVCKINSDIVARRYNDDGAPIGAVWATKYDDDGTPSYYKTLLKRGCCVTLKPMSRSSGTVYLRTDRSGGEEQAVAQDTMDIFDWEDIDFSRFTFNSDDGPQEIFFQKKIKNYKRLQIIIRNAEADEGFGVYQITKHYVVGNFAKKSGQSVGAGGIKWATDKEVAASSEKAWEDVFEEDVEA